MERNKKKQIRVRSWSRLMAYYSEIDKKLLSQAERPWVLFNQAELIKDDKSTSVARIHGAPGYIIKRFNARSFGHKLKRALRKSRAQCCWEMSVEFVRAGLKVAPAQFMYESRFGPFKRGGYFINQNMEGEELLHYLPRISGPEQEAVIAKLHQAFARMQQHRISHGDMKASNLLWYQGEIYFIDLDVAQKHRFDFTWRRAARRDKKRFLKNWRDFPELLQKLDWLQSS